MAARKTTKKASAKRKRPSSTGKVKNVRADQSNWRKKLQTSRLKFDDDQKAVYLEEFAKHGRKADAAKVAGVSFQTVGNHRENDPEFAEAEAAALEVYRSRLIDHHQTLLFEGELHQRFDKDGNLVESKRVYPIQLISMELKKHDQGYREKQTVDLHHAGGVMVAPAEMTPEEWVKSQMEKNKTRTKLGEEK